MSDFWYTFNVLLSFILGMSAGALTYAIYIEHRDKKREQDGNN
jgi:hypothetical protein